MQTTLKISDIHQKLILEHIQTHPTLEVCGLLGGIWQGKTAIVHKVVPIENISPTPEIRYAMNPQQQIQTMLAFDKQGWQIVGIYHSHPNGTATPSPADIREAYYLDAVYVIGLPNGELKAWQIVGRETKGVQIIY